MARPRTWREIIERRSIATPSVSQFLQRGGTSGASSSRASRIKEFLTKPRQVAKPVARIVNALQPRNLLRTAVYFNPFSFTSGGYSPASRIVGGVAKGAKSLFKVPETLSGFFKKTFLTGLVTSAPFVSYDFVKSHSPGEFFSRLAGQAKFIGGLFINPIGAVTAKFSDKGADFIDWVKELPPENLPPIDTYFPDNLPDFNLQMPNITMPSFEMPSLPSISVGGGGGLGMEALMMALLVGAGATGYAVGKRKRKKTKYKKRRKHKRR